MRTPFLTLIGVSTRNKYVLAVYAPGSRSTIRRLFESMRPWRAIAPGDVFSIGRERLRVVDVEVMVARHGSCIAHRSNVITELARAADDSNVVPMPIGESSIVADFLRCHVLVRVFGGDPEAWLDALRHQSEDALSGGDVRFVRRVRARLRDDPMLLAAIRRMVDTTPLAMNKAWP